MTAMQSPRRIASAASPTLWVPVAQADTTHMLWPIAPVSIAIIPEQLSVSALAMKVGATVRGPRALSESQLSSMSVCPPAPDPKITPTSVRFSSVTSKPESASACFAAATPKCMLASLRRAAFGSIQSDGTKSWTSPPSLASYGVVSNRVIGPRPDTPLTRLAHAVAGSLPTELMTPRPVTTTRRS